MRVEAAAFQGKPVFFRLIGEWTQPPRMQAPPATAGKKAGQILGTVILMSMMAAALWLALRNHRQGRGDQEGGLRLAKLVFALLLALWLLRTHLVPSFDTFGLTILALATALFLSTLIFVLYLALEPYVRRYWPHAVISWTRLLGGDARDPLVGRDILLGVLLGVIWLLVFKVNAYALMKMGETPALLSSDYLVSFRLGLGAWLAQIPQAILGTLEFFFLLLGLKLGLKRDWIATIVFVSIITALRTLGSTHMLVDAITSIVVYLILALIVYRFGLVSLACAIFTVDLLANVPFTGDLSAWYFGTTMFALLSVVALAAWGFYHALGKASFGPSSV